MTAAASPSPEAVVDRFIALIVACDLDAACELVTDDLVYDNVPMGANHGPDGLKAFLGPMVDGLDEVEFVIHRQTATGSIVMNERTDRFRLGDRWMELPVAGVFEVDETGRISLWRDFFDVGTLNGEMAKLAG